MAQVSKLCGVVVVVYFYAVYIGFPLSLLYTKTWRTIFMFFIYLWNFTWNSKVLFLL